MSIYLSFPFTIDPNSHEVCTAKEEQYIKESLYCILMTHVMERYMLPEFGSRIQDYVFETNMAEHLHMLEKEILASIGKWGFAIDDVQVVLHPQKETLQIELNYQINGKATAAFFEMEMM